MPVSLLDRVALLAHERQAFLEALASLSPEARSHRPEADVWSPLDIAEHVFRVERASLAGLERQVAAGPERKALGSASRAKLAALLFALRSPKKFSVPEGARGITPEGIAYEVLCAEWAALEPRWTAVLAALPPDLESVALIKHPIAGPLTADGTLQFLLVHAARHRGQLHRAIRRSA
jgi:uncharacterized damage-inducible protein DinB